MQLCKVLFTGKMPPPLQRFDRLISEKMLLQQENSFVTYIIQDSTILYTMTRMKFNYKYRQQILFRNNLKPICYTLQA